MRTALTLLAVAVGKLLCRLGRHKWGPWKRYIRKCLNLNTGITTAETTERYYRTCRRCGKTDDEEARCDTS